jgi:hypothetical protein
VTFVDEHLPLLVILGVTVAVLGLAVVAWGLERLVALCRRPRPAGSPPATVADTPSSPSAGATTQPPAAVRPDAELAAWLEAHHDELMWWKEYLQHEGVGQRTPEEEAEARARYQQELARLAAEAEAREEEVTRRWEAEGLTREEARARWAALDDAQHRDSRLRYALGKD